MRNPGGIKKLIEEEQKGVLGGSLTRLSPEVVPLAKDEVSLCVQRRSHLAQPAVAAAALEAVLVPIQVQSLEQIPAGKRRRRENKKNVVLTLRNGSFESAYLSWIFFPHPAHSCTPVDFWGSAFTDIVILLQQREEVTSLLAAEILSCLANDKCAAVSAPLLLHPAFIQTFHTFEEEAGDGEEEKEVKARGCGSVLTPGRGLFLRRQSKKP